MRRSHLLAFVGGALTLSFGIAACGGQTAAPADPVAAFAVDYRDTICGIETTCSTLAQYLQIACALQPALPNEVAAVAAGRASFDASAAQACLDTLGGLSCAEYGTLAETIPNTFPGTCGQVFQGHVAPGAACWTDAECAGGVCVLGTSCPGVCRAKKKPGDACTSQDCGYSDHACLGDDRCGSIGAAGDSCYAPTAECGFGLTCSTPLPPGGVCAAGAPKGASCLYETCAHGLVCLGNTCADPLPRGATCTDPDVCEDGDLCAGLVIASLDGLEPNTPGKCAAPADVGGDCVPFQPEVTITGCATGLGCAGGHCALPPSSGPCGDESECAPGFYCTSTIPSGCAAQKPAGAPCTDASECAGGVSCVGSACQAAGCYAPAP